MRSAIIVGVLGLASMVGFVHCSASPSVCRASECAALGPDADASDDSPGVPPLCDPAKDPSCVTNENGVFVDGAGGDDTAAGTKEKPARSITAALGKLGARRQVFICGEGPFAEHVKITSAISLHGGFSCGDWARANVKARVAPSDPGYGLELRGASGGVLVADMAFEAMAGTPEFRSSIGILIANSADVTLRRINVKANDGFRGADGADAKVPVSTPEDRKGNDATLTTGGDQKPCTCSTGGASKGGNGGDTGTLAPDGTNGETAPPTTPDPPSATGVGGTRLGCETTNAPGKNGSNGPPALNAATPPLALLDATGWHSGNGDDGRSGSPGQGGGGGGSYVKDGPTENGGGSGGGCGGCGGGGGGGGTAGGSSIAIAMFQASVTIDASELISSDGAPGGIGKGGADGTEGGNPGQTVQLACRGGKGGKGGKGGAGAGGAGGVSAGIVYKGTAPVTVTSDIRLGTGGAPGTGGAGNDGPKGPAESVIQVP